MPVKRLFQQAVSVKDLQVSRKAQHSVGSEHILSVSDQGKSRNESELLDLGAELAEERQVRSTVATKIRLGLYACAKDNPIALEPARVSELIRQALFDEEKAPAEVDPEIREYLHQRARQSKSMDTTNRNLSVSSTNGYGDREIRFFRNSPNKRNNPCKQPTNVEYRETDQPVPPGDEE